MTALTSHSSSSSSSSSDHARTVQSRDEKKESKSTSQNQNLGLGQEFLEKIYKYSGARAHHLVWWPSLWEATKGEEEKAVEEQSKALLQEVKQNGIKTLNLSSLIKFKAHKGVEPFLTFNGHLSEVLCLDFLSKYTFASGSKDTTVRLWDIESLKCLGTLKGHQGQVNAVVALSEEALASGSEDKTVRIWNATKCQCLTTIEEDAAINAMIYFGGGLVCGLENHRITKRNIKNGEKIAYSYGYTDSAVSSLFSLFLPNDIVIGFSDGSIQIEEDLGSGRHHGYDNREENSKKLGSIVSLTGLCVGVLGRFFVSGDSKGIITIWQHPLMMTYIPHRNLYGHKVSVKALGTLSKELFISGSSDGVIKIWNVKTGECLFTLSNLGFGINSLVVLPTGDIAVGADDFTVRLLKPKAKVSPTSKQITDLLEALQTNTSVSELNLSENPRITDGIIDPLIAIFKKRGIYGFRTQNTTLKTIDLRKTQVTKVGIERLEKAIKSESLSVEILTDWKEESLKMERAIQEEKESKFKAATKPKVDQEQKKSQEMEQKLAEEKAKKEKQEQEEKEKQKMAKKEAEEKKPQEQEAEEVRRKREQEEKQAKEKAEAAAKLKKEQEEAKAKLEREQRELEEKTRREMEEKTKKEKEQKEKEEKARQEIEEKARKEKERQDKEPQEKQERERKAQEEKMHLEREAQAAAQKKLEMEAKKESEEKEKKEVEEKIRKENEEKLKKESEEKGQKEQKEKEERQKSVETKIVQEVSTSQDHFLQCCQSQVASIQSLSACDLQALRELDGKSPELRSLLKKETAEQLAALERAEILQNDPVADYYFVFIRLFTDQWIACQAIHSGKIDNDEKELLEYIGKGIDSVGKHIPILSAVTGMVESSISALYYRGKKNAVNQIANYFDTLFNANEIIETVARYLALFQCVDIQKLAAQKPGVFKRMLQALKKLKDTITVNDVDTEIRRKAAADVKKILEAIISGELKPHPTLANVMDLFHCVVGQNAVYVSPVVQKIQTPTQTQSQTQSQTTTTQLAVHSVSQTSVSTVCSTSGSMSTMSSTASTLQMLSFGVSPSTQSIDPQIIQEMLANQKAQQEKIQQLETELKAAREKAERAEREAKATKKAVEDSGISVGEESSQLVVSASSNQKPKNQTQESVELNNSQRLDQVVDRLAEHGIYVTQSVSEQVPNDATRKALFGDRLS